MIVKHLENNNLEVLIQDLTINIGEHNDADTDIVITLSNGKIINISPEFNAINFFDDIDAFNTFDLDNTRIVLIDESNTINCEDV